MLWEAALASRAGNVWAKIGALGNCGAWLAHRGTERGVSGTPSNSHWEEDLMECLSNPRRRLPAQIDGQ